MINHNFLHNNTRIQWRCTYTFQNVCDTQYAQSQIPATFFVLEVASRLNAKMRGVIIVISQSSVYVSDPRFVLIRKQTLINPSYYVLCKNGTLQWFRKCSFIDN